jgi:hypothetical protein
MVVEWRQRYGEPAEGYITRAKTSQFVNEPMTMLCIGAVFEKPMNLWTKHSSNREAKSMPDSAHYQGLWWPQPSGIQVPLGLSSLVRTGETLRGIRGWYDLCLKTPLLLSS